MAKAPKAKTQEPQADKPKNYITESEVHAALEAAQDDPSKKADALALYEKYSGPFKLNKTPIPRGVQETARALRTQ